MNQSGNLGSGSDSPANPVGEFTFVLHGAGGDLAKRKIIPALAQLASVGYFSPGARLIFAQREALSPAQALAEVDAFLARTGNDAARATLPALAPLLSTCSVRLGEATAKAALDAAIAQGPHPVVHYAALPSSRFKDLIACLPEERSAQRLRLVLEKPLGFNARESADIEAAAAAKFNEDQIFRIDHYLGKQAVQNLLALRLGNRIFEPLLTREHVASVQITVAEDLGVEDRAGFYEHAGALRDMVQSHMLQLLAIVAMEPPVSLEANSLRDEKLKVLRSLKVPQVLSTPEIITGQYADGYVKGQPVPGYLNEPGVQAHSCTETYVAFRTEVQTWRWAGVPFLLRTGKRMPRRFAEIVIQFRDVPKPLYEPVGGHWSGNQLVIHLQPDDKLELKLLAKTPGERLRLKPVSLDLDFFNTWRIPVRDAYERLITDILRGRLSLFLRRDEVQTQWEFVDRILSDLKQHGLGPVPYTSGTYGPSAATAMALRTGALWSEDGVS
ncbi:glucose-6-phosphate dehydrogenase [Limnobacter humi]|uniref:Glucose-6-phosphate 1-dehydrogenase n=1 Tax=Limnobacter humi TaxID=1778671 RepID=A0ABT1WI82_9BURK|nr:glucose-6-phosphate dehydrogenase [Limnobacter humi]MCQ8896751.1 glucose-6-phosphate dehydrogenase [Limnobacter humi]